jgi:GNAT superfamily N-acetyltransferase
MKNPEAVEIELLSEVHLPEALRLTEQSQWNQTALDWRRLLQCPPGGCFGAFHDGRLIGPFITVVYGTELAWVGMMLVDSDYRRRGFGTRLMRAALEHLQRIGVKSIKLDATPAGSESLVDRGLVKQRDLTQMGFGSESRAGISKRIFGLAGPEMG